MFATFVMFSWFYRELKEALVLMVPQGTGDSKETKVLLHIYNEEEGLLEIFEFTILSQVRKANGWIFQEAPGSEASLVYQEI